MSIANPTSFGFAKSSVNTYLLENPTRKRSQQKTPKTIVAVYYVISMLNLYLSFNISKRALTIQSLHPTSERLLKVYSIWGKFSQEKESYFDHFFIG